VKQLAVLERDALPWLDRQRAVHAQLSSHVVPRQWWRHLGALSPPPAPRPESITRGNPAYLKQGQSSPTVWSTPRSSGQSQCHTLESWPDARFQNIPRKAEQEVEGIPTPSRSGATRPTTKRARTAAGSPSGDDSVAPRDHLHRQEHTDRQQDQSIEVTEHGDESQG